jgi:hypothetical protein
MITTTQCVEMIINIYCIKILKQFNQQEQSFKSGSAVAINNKRGNDRQTQQSTVTVQSLPCQQRELQILR